MQMRRRTENNYGEREKNVCGKNMVSVSSNIWVAEGRLVAAMNWNGRGPETLK